jgi:hypothetical protein
MLTHPEWQKIKAELKKNIEPVFTKAGTTLSVPFEQVLDIFQVIIEKEIGDNDLDDREKIGEALKIRYIQKDGNLYSTALFSLAIKLETYFKRLYKIANETLWTDENNKMKGQIVTFVKKHKHTFSDTDFATANDVSAFDNPDKKFYKTNSSNKPIFSPEDLKGLFPFSEQFKWTYDIANSQRHSDPSVSEDDLPKLITYVITCYLYVTSKYAKRLSKELIHQPDNTTVSNWGIFKQYCGNFQKNQAYYLVVDKLNLSKEQLSYFANIKWDFVFDFDINSENNGLLNAVRFAGYFPQEIYQIIQNKEKNDRGKITATFPSNTTFWYFTQGNTGTQKSLVQSVKIVDWRTMYGRYTQDLMIKYYENNYSRSHNPIKVVILSKDIERIKDIVYAVKGMNQNLNIEFIFANEDNSQIQALIDEISGKKIDISLHTLLEGLREMKGLMFPANSTNEIHLPCHSSKGKSKILPNADVLSVKQFFQIIDLDILNEDEEQLSDKTFYQGRGISWRELDSRLDVDRNITKDIIKAVKNLLEKRTESEIIYLSHYAGVGGSTVAKRVAFELYTEYPVLFLNETISSFGETLLVEKLLKVFQTTELPTLVVVDNSNITRQQIEILERVTGNRLAKTVFLLVESTFSEPKQEKNKYYLPSALDNKEIERFYNKFIKEYPTKKDNFDQLLKQNYNSLNPFYFGLIANEEEYISLDNYVLRRIDGITDKETDLLKLLAFCQIFAKGKLREVPHFIISKFLGIDEDFIRLKKYTQNHKIHDLIIETDNLSWKTIHPIIAHSILKQTMGVNETGNIDIYALKDFAIRLIKSLRNISDHRNEEVLELLHNLFIQRGDDNSIDGEEADTDFSDNLYNRKLFSKFINDLENNNNRIEIFEVLTTEFLYENAHFWGHFSRLYSINKDFENALKTIENALEIDEDFIFYHIKGMCYRTELYRLKDKCWGNNDEAKNQNELMRSYFDKASEAFEIAREVAPQKEHGYIAFIQMAIQMIEFQYSISSLKTTNKDYTQFITTNAWCRSLLVQSNEVINDYKDYNQEFENPKIKEKQIQLLKFFGEKEKMISAWNNLLGKKEFDQNLVRRQLSYALLAKNEFDWERAKGKDLNRIIEHIEENLNNKVEVRDLQLWFVAARRINTNVSEIIKKVEQWEFQKPSLDTAYFLMCLYAVQAINGIKSGVDNYEKYQKNVAERIKTTYSKVFCVEWVGFINGNATLLNNKQIGVWVRDKQFFEKEPHSLMRLKGKVIKYISRTQGYIEIENVGVQVMYQPAHCNHYSDDVQKGTRVEFYLGFNYDGARAFEVKNE